MPTIAELQDALVNADRAGDAQAARQLADAIVAAQKVEEAKPASVQAGGLLREAGRQTGLAARYGIEGLAQTADIIHEPIRALVNLGSDQPRAGKSLREMASGLADTLGLPTPQGANERVIGDATRAVAGVGGLAGVSRLAAQGTTGTTAEVLNMMARRPDAQAVTAATGGLAGGAVRESGGGPGAQFTASLLGGIGGGLGYAGAAKLAGAAKSALTPRTTQLQQADQQIALVLERQGIDWTQVPEGIRQSVRDQAARAMAGGQGLNGDALRRLVIMQRAGVTPTVGQLTQDPGQITREMNLAKAGANSVDPTLQRLPQLQNQNVGNLLRRLDESGAAQSESSFDTGQRVIGSLEGTANRARQEINALYGSARDSAGRSLPLEGGTFTTRASQLIDEAMVGGALPTGVQNTLNKIAKGEMPLTVEIAEQLKTQVGKLQRASSDGQTRMALGLVRQALDETPLMRGQNPGNLPGQAGNAGQEAINAFDLARSANRQWMTKVEGNPALRAVTEGVEPDQFVSRFIVGKQASSGDVQALRQAITPEAAQSVKNYIVRYLRDAATNNTDDIAKFSNSAYRKALQDIGDQKLAVFFSPEEVQNLRDVGNAAKYLQAQPAGSAVNNSNSGAMLMGMGLDWLGTVAPKLPLGLKDTITGIVQGQQQRQVLTPANALRLPAPADQSANLLSPLPLLAGSASAQGADDQGRDKRAKKDRVN